MIQYAHNRRHEGLFFSSVDRNATASRIAGELSTIQYNIHQLVVETATQDAADDALLLRSLVLALRKHFCS